MSDGNRELTLLCNGVDVPWLASYESFTTKIFPLLKYSCWEVSVTFCTDEVIRELNRDFRGKDEATDVLSFEADSESSLTGGDPEDVLCGDLVISLDMLKANSAYFEVEEEEELKRLTVHGLLHLSGWDHTTNDPAEPMLARQEEILKALGKEKVL